MNQRPEPYERELVDASPDLVVGKLRELLAERNITEYAVVDHGHDMAAAGAPAFEAWTLIFGDPAAGSKLLDHDLAAAVDIPLRLGVVRGEDGTEIVRRDLKTLLPAQIGDLAGSFNSVLQDLTRVARQRAEAAGRP